jgi:hypothetical protein
MVHMIIRAVEAFENADPKTRTIFFWAFVVVIGLTVAEQVYF